jgi:hypothetical protein
MSDEETVYERPSRRAAPIEAPPARKQYRVVRTITVRGDKFRPGDIIDDTHPKLRYDWCLRIGAIEEV